jgi:hypothetical protein
MSVFERGRGGGIEKGNFANAVFFVFFPDGGFLLLEHLIIQALFKIHYETGAFT